MSAYSLRKRLDLGGLELAPAQTWGNVRLVPLCRRPETIRGDLRLARRSYGEDVAVVSLDGALSAPGIKYVSFIPHGLVVSWNGDGTPVAAFGTRLEGKGDATRRPDGKTLGRSVRLLHRMVKREAEGALRLLPLHLAMEGLLALHFGGPEIAWVEYSRRAISSGLDPREERAVSGAALPGFDEALRVFEIHENQVGVLIFIADALASAFVVPHPDDYRALHRSLLEDFYGELLFRYGLLYPDVAPAEARIDDREIRSLADLRAGVARVREEWADFAGLLAQGIFEEEVRAEVVYRMASYRLERFVTDLKPHQENHLGEAIVDEGGALAYLKTYRLSDVLVRRAYLLVQLAAHGWSLEETAAGLGVPRDELIRRLDNAGFGYLLKPHVLEAARARTARR